MVNDNLKGLAIPEHIGIIMDGNGRWAKKRGLERSEGHKAGAEVFRTICDYCADIGVKAVTFYAFSTENWKRPQKEVEAIMNLFREYLGEAKEREEENRLNKKRFRYIGSREGLSDDIVAMIEMLENGIDFEPKITINLAINYGGRNEIVNAVKNIAEKVQRGEVKIDEITEDTVTEELYTYPLPDPDLIIRPSGELRLSNFLIWQGAYSELWFSSVLWPDFTTDDLDRAIIDFNKRSRRFGS